VAGIIDVHHYFQTTSNPKALWIEHSSASLRGTCSPEEETAQDQDVSIAPECAVG
jgi:hypothetical protein